MTDGWKIVKHVEAHHWRRGFFDYPWQEAYNVWANDQTGEVVRLPVGETPQSIQEHPTRAEETAKHDRGEKHQRSWCSRCDLDERGPA